MSIKNKFNFHAVIIAGMTTAMNVGVAFITAHACTTYYEGSPPFIWGSAITSAAIIAGLNTFMTYDMVEMVDSYRNKENKISEEKITPDKFETFTYDASL